MSGCYKLSSWELDSFPSHLSLSACQPVQYRWWPQVPKLNGRGKASMHKLCQVGPCVIYPNAALAKQIQGVWQFTPSFDERCCKVTMQRRIQKDGFVATSQSITNSVFCQLQKVLRVLLSKAVAHRAQKQHMQLITLAQCPAFYTQLYNPLI